MNAKKILLPLFAVLSLTSCAGASASTPDASEPNTSAPSVSTGDQAASEDANLFAFEAATSIGLLSTLETTATPTVSAMAARAVSDTLKKQIETYLPSIEATLKGTELLTETVVLESDRPEYQTKLSITYKDLNAEDSAFVMYYNEVKKAGDWDDWFEGEEEYVIEGIVVLGQKEYKMRGTRETEKGESEVAFRYFLDETSYVHVQQESERGETAFEYEVYQKGRKIHEYSLEREEKRGQVEVELEIMDRENAIDGEMTFVDYERDGKYYIRVDIENQGTLYYAKAEDGSYYEVTF